MSRTRTPAIAALAVAALAVGAVQLGSPAGAAAPVGVSNPGFEAGGSSSTPPSCWQLGSVGTGTATAGVSATARSGNRSAKLSVTALSSGANRKIVIDQRTAGCAPAAVAGHAYLASLYYQASTPVRMTAYYRDGGGWHYWTESGVVAARSSWGLLQLTTPPVPSGATALSFGATVTSTGSMLLDDAALTDLTAAAPTPTATPTSPTASPTATPKPTATPTAKPTATPTATPTPAPTSTAAGDVVRVATAAQLSSALSNARAGQTIQLADGVYRGNFTLARSGTSAAPIRVVGSRNAVLDGGGVSSGYVLHLDRANYVRLDGFGITNGQKALVLDQSSSNTLTNLDLRTTGEEILLVRNFSSDNVISNNQVHDAGRTNAGYGEGVYIGLAKSNWSSSGQSRTGGAPDTSNRNQIIGNTIYGTTAENVDIKEGTSGGLIANNSFNSTGMSGANYADSWVDIAGNGYTVRGNVGTNPGSKLLDGYQTHIQTSGGASNNVFDGNRSAVNAGGYAINIQTPASGNVVRSSNTVTGAAKGLTNISVSP